LKLIKAEFLKKQTEPGRKEKELNDEEQTKILLKMASQREDSIKQYTNGGRQDLADAERKELQIIEQFTPKQPTDDELADYTCNIIQQYVKDKTEGYKLSMKDMKPIMTMVKEKYPTANGKIVSQTLQKAINS
jgi:uncharacterized protein YqeY